MEETGDPESDLSPSLQRMTRVRVSASGQLASIETASDTHSRS
jgi:hypothetical protein